MNENHDNLPPSKRQKKQKHCKNFVFIYNAKEKKAYVYSIKDDRKFDSFFKWINWLKNQGYFKEKRSVIATIFLKSNFTSLSIASILYTDYTLYWKATSLINTIDIRLSIQEKVLPEGKFTRTAIQKIIGGLEFNFFKKGQQEKKLLILTRNNVHRYEVYVFDQLMQEKYLPVSVKEVERILDEIINFIRYIFAVSICHGMSTSVKEESICKNCAKLKKTMQQIQKKCLTGPNFVKAIHASKEILIEKVNQQRKVIKRQNELLIIDLKKCLKEKIEKK
ncbi:hypothetical protein RhiirC2_776956 [Rhizophagus irregularis]|uniref:Uncharacterized protein n=1 Tax=Rhizophagus irregularis TaxID=588596 RepID=A0A2N1NFF1_9GLOM|nr:hypothetical protein RhiirC2_776956 [Rhizophagus irregularis]